MKKILITGANSYIGTSFEKYIYENYRDEYQIDTLDMMDSNWKEYDFNGYDSIFHVAGIAHADVGNVSKETEKLYYQVNCDLAYETALKAKKSKVKQFIYMSSIIVYGESAPYGKTKIITKDTKPEPANFYGDSKLQAEIKLRKLKDDYFSVCVLRPPMIYGPGSKGNYQLLSKLAKKVSIFPNVNNKRSVLHIENLCLYLIKCIEETRDGIYFPQDEERISTSKMVEKLANENNKKIFMTRCLNPFIFIISRMPGKISKLCNKAFGSIYIADDLSDGLDLSIENLRVKIKICAITTISKNLDWFVVDSMKNLYNHGYEISYISKMDDEFIKNNSDYAKCYNINMKRGISLREIFVQIYAFYKIFKCNKFDIVQYSTPNAAFYASIASFFSGIPCRVYCQWGLRYVALQGINRKIFKNVEKITCMFSTDIREVSKKNMEIAINDKLTKKEKIKVLGQGGTIGVDLTKYKIEKREIYNFDIREEYGIPNNAFVLGFVGRINKDKGINELIEAFKKISDIDNNVYLFLVGMMDDVNPIEKNNLDYINCSKKIITTGNVDNYLIPKFLSCFNLLVHPTYREGFGMILQEALAMKTPIITTDIPGPSEVIEKDISGFLVKPCDVNELYNAILFLMNNRQLLKLYAENGYVRVNKYFDRKVMLENILNDYQDIVWRKRNA